MDEKTCDVCGESIPAGEESLANYEDFDTGEPRWLCWDCADEDEEEEEDDAN